jgi:DNA-binding transcriptional LysR family regulator
MLTFKQIEALYWIAELGNFAAAADKLNTSQSAVSKRIQELETAFGVEIFDRRKRTARLTEKGEELLVHARDLLERRDRAVERVSAADVLLRRFRLGVTELTALTWLPALIDAIRGRYPRLVIEPEVGISSELFERLEADSIDMIIVPDVFDDARCVLTPLKSVENVWMCSPTLAETVLAGRDPNEPIRLEEIPGLTVLTQGERSGTGIIYGRWLRQNGIRVARQITCDNLIAQLGFTVSGLGITYLPIQTMRPLLRRGLLQVIGTTPRLPRVRYATLYRAERSPLLCADVTRFAEQTCSFSASVLGEGVPPLQE